MNIYQVWLIHALFWLGIAVILLGLFLIVMPSKIMSFNIHVNKWISTDGFFQNLDKPRYKESHFYKQHRFLGILILAGSSYILYMLFFRADVDAIAKLLPIVSNFNANAWIYQSLIIFLIVTNTVIFFLSLVIIVRPSLLKKMEGFFNKWIQSGKSLEHLNSQYDIPDKILPGNVRLFGLVVLAGGIYIALSTGVLIIK